MNNTRSVSTYSGRLVDQPLNQAKTCRVFAVNAPDKPDFELLARYAADPVFWATSVLGFEPDQHQAFVLKATSGRIILNCCRQWGKSTVTAAKAAHRALFTPDSSIIVISRTLRQAGELVRKIDGMFHASGCITRRDGINDISLVLPNGSRIVGLPGAEANIRGFSAVDLLVIDEASRVEDDVYRAARPMLATRNGDVILLSTPYGKRGFFWDEWSRKADPWIRVEIKATGCSRISPEFLDSERRSLGSKWFDQEYMCSFLETEYSLFSREMIEAAIDPNLKPLCEFDDDGWPIAFDGEPCISPELKATMQPPYPNADIRTPGDEITMYPSSGDSYPRNTKVPF